MQIFESTLLLLVVAVGLAALARRWHAPYPALLAALGVALAFLPAMPRFVLEPQLALALFVAPVLLDAAYDTSPRDLRDNWAPIAGLVFVAVGVTTAAVAWTAKALAPDLSWAAAIALGAIVAPPDAAAATAVLRTMRPPHRIVQVLEGESLFNDATALLTYRFAVGAAMGANLSTATAIPTIALVVAGSIAGGAAVAWVMARIQRRIEDVPTAVVLQFASTFGVWLLAERVGLSGILTVVAYAIAIARVAPHFTPARIRVPSYAVWETVVFVLNVLAFILIGLQLGPIVEQLSPAERIGYAKVALTVLGVAIGARIAWVMSFNTFIRWKVRRFGMRGERPLLRPTIRGGIIISWCGMRGIVTLAAALALPDAFPGRALILVTAFSVVLGTLLLQGLTLRPLLRWLDLRDDDPVEREVATARRAALRAALAAVDGDRSPAADILRFEFAELWPDSSSDQSRGHDGAGGLPELRQRAVNAARAELAALVANETIGDDAFHRLEVELDRAELYAEAARPHANA